MADNKNTASKMKTPENSAHVQQVLICRAILSQEPDIGNSSRYRIALNDVKLFPYKIQMQQSLGEGAKDKTTEIYSPFLCSMMGNPVVL
jgi:hypothetical protein